MASTSWPIRDLQEARADEAGSLFEEMLLGFEERWKPRAQPATPAPAAFSLDIDRAALKPWEAPAAPEPRVSTASAGGLFDREALTPWERPEVPTPATLIPGPDLSPESGLPIVTGYEGTERASVPPTVTNSPKPAPTSGGGDLRSHAERMAQKYGLDFGIFDRQLNQESGYRVDAVSSAGARGPGQFMPATGAAVARQLGVTPEQFWASPELQVEGAALHMRDLLAANRGDYRFALAAYNAGQGNVDKWGEGVFGADFANGQTRDYVNIILGPGAANPRVSNAAGSGAPVAASPPFPAVAQRPPTSAPSAGAQGSDDDIVIRNPRQPGAPQITVKRRMYGPTSDYGPDAPTYTAAAGWEVVGDPRQAQAAGSSPAGLPSAPAAAGAPQPAAGVSDTMARMSLEQPADQPVPGSTLPGRLRPARPPAPAEVGATALDEARAAGWGNPGALDREFEPLREIPRAPLSEPADTLPGDGAVPPQPAYDPDQGPRETGYTVPGSQPSGGAPTVADAATSASPAAPASIPGPDLGPGGFPIVDQPPTYGPYTSETTAPPPSPDQSWRGVPLQAGPYAPIGPAAPQVPQTDADYAVSQALGAGSPAIRELGVAPMPSMPANTREPVMPPRPFEEAAPFQDEQSREPGPAYAQPALAPALPGASGRTLTEAIQQAQRSPSQAIGPLPLYQALQELPWDVYATARRQLISDAEARHLAGTDPLGPLRDLAAEYGIALPDERTLNPEGRPATDVLAGLLLAGALPDPADPYVAAAFRGAGRAIGATSRGVQAAGQRVGQHLALNAERVAQADARMAGQGSTVAPGVFGALPEPTRGQPTVEVLAEQIEHARRVLDDLDPAAEPELVGMVRDRIARLQSEWVDAQNARLDLEPRIRSDVGRRDETVPITEDRAEMLESGSRWARERVSADPSELSGPVRIPTTNPEDRLNVSAGTIPTPRAAGPLGAVNRAASEAIAGGTAGAVVEQARNPDEDPRTAAARGFVVGAAGFPVATRLARGAARAAGAGADTGGGALATFGAVPGGASDPLDVVSKRIAKLIKNDQPEADRLVGEFKRLMDSGAGPSDFAAYWRGVEERNKIKPGEVFALYRRFNMLSGPRTFEVNGLSGALNLAYEVVTQGVGRAATGRLREAGAEVAAPFRAAGRAFGNLTETLWHGVTTEQAMRGDIPETLSSRTDNLAAKGALTAMEIPDRLNAAVDQFYRTLTEEWAATTLANNLARADGVKPGSPKWAETVAVKLDEIRADPTKYPRLKQMADRVTFAEEPGGLVKWLEEGKRKYPNIIGFVAPFVRTPANIASRAVDLSPVGPVRMAVEAGLNVGRGRQNLTPRVRDNIIGVAATYWAYEQAKQGNITGAGPDDPEKIAMLRATGWQPYSIKIGDRYWSYANFAPFSLALSTGAAVHEAQQYAKEGKTDTLSMLSDGAARTGKVITDMTVLAGLGAVVKSIQDPDRYGTQWLSQSLQQLMPAGSFVNTIGQATDPNIRRSERTDVGTQISQNLQARVPGLRENVPAAQDPLGRPIPNEQTGLGALNPFRPTTERDDPVMQAFIDAKVDIGKPREKLTINEVAVPITSEEQRRWNEIRGQEIEKRMRTLIANGSLERMPPERRQERLEGIRNAASERADDLVWRSIPLQERNRRRNDARKAS